MAIKAIHAREILDSRGNPTVEAELLTENGTFRAAVPSGASTGTHEALELRDNEKHYGGKGVTKAIMRIKESIEPALRGMDEREQQKIDDTMKTLDGTKNKENLGANAILAVSMAACRAGALANNLPLHKHLNALAGNPPMQMPVPSFNVLNGGSHAGNGLAMQEFMILPVGAESYKEALRMGTETYHVLKSIIKERYGIDNINVGDEGGFAPAIDDNTTALELVHEAIRKAGYDDKVKLGMDIAASEFYEDGKYNLGFKTHTKDCKTADELIEIYRTFVSEFGIISLEDPFAEDDWQAFTKITSSLGNQIQIVGDDILVTNPERIKRAIEENACNALLLKVNQIGSVTEGIEAWRMAVNAGWNVMVSHRSGETEDTFIADLCVALGCGQIKTGAPCRGERTCKYNQLLRIEEEGLPYARLQ